MIKNVSVTSLLSVLFQIILLLLFPLNIWSQPIVRHNNTKCSKATIIPSNVTLPYFNNPTNSFYLAPIDRETSKIFANCSLNFIFFARYAWYTWRPNTSGFYDIIASSFDDYSISVLQGNTCDTLDTSVLVCPFRTAQRSVYLEKRIKYYFPIYVYSYSTSTNLDFTIQRTSPSPSNDECYNAIRIPSSLTLPYTTSEIDVTGATINRNSELIPTCDPNYKIDRRTVQRFGTLLSYWYVWTPSSTGYYKLDVTYNKTICDSFTCGFAPPPTIAVYENGNSFNCNRTSTWKQISCIGNGITDSIAEFVAGQTYYIQILPIINSEYLRDTDLNTLKSVMLTIQPSQAPPINDLCVNAIPIDPIHGLNATSTDTTYASAETDVVVDNHNLLNGIWYKYNQTIGLPKINLRFCNSARPFIFPMQMFVTILKGNHDCTSLYVMDDYVVDGCPFNFNFIPFEENTIYYILVENSQRIPLQISFTKKYFNVINSVTDKTIVYDLPRTTGYGFGELTSSKLNMEAYFHPDYVVNSVFVTFDKPSRSRCERKYPFSLFGNRNGDFYNATIPLGSHYVTATPYTGSDCKGSITTSPLKQNFTVKGCGPTFSLFRFNSPGSSGFVTYLHNNIRSIPCNVTLRGSVYCPFQYESIQLKIFDTISNTSIAGEAVNIPGVNTFSFGQLNSSAPFGVNPINLPPSRKYEATVTIDNIEHPPVLFSIKDVCTPT
jgi:hypothetical protein